MSMNFVDLMNKVDSCTKKTIAVAVAQDEAVLEAVEGARKRNIAEAILFGDQGEIEEAAKKAKLDLSNFKIVDIADKVEAARAAVKSVHDGESDMYMKGLLPTKDALRAVLDKDIGLRSGKLLSHIGVFEVEGINRLLFVTDAAFNMYPTLGEKKEILENAVLVAHACGVDTPKVAPLAAVEVVNPKMPATVDAMELTKMNQSGDIKGCIIDGPLALDLAISKESSIHKGILDRKVAGDADILLVPTIEVGNVLYKAFAHIGKSQNGAILVGTSAPVVLTSRSDTYITKLNSIALAAIISEQLQQGEK